MVIQRKMPTSPSWLVPGPPDFHGYAAPARTRPALADVPYGDPVLTVIGTVHNESAAFLRSWRLWERQKLEPWMVVDFLVLDDGSTDDIGNVIADLRREGGDLVPRLRYAKMRAPGGPDRSCTLAFNRAIRHLVRTPLVMIQWWDRLPGSFDHLAKLLKPHAKLAGIATSAISRHIGGSSSMHEMTSAELESELGRVDWMSQPSELGRIAGTIGNHCIPGNASESSGLVIPVAEFEALGGYDERYQERAGYANVELFRRVLQSGLQVVFPGVENYHQSHAANRVKSQGWLDDLKVLRNSDHDWGVEPPIEVR